VIMAESLQSPPVLTEDLADIFLETVVEEDVPIEPSPLLDLEPEASAPRRPRRLLIGLSFGIGLAIGWLLIGWWLWPVQVTSAPPWHMSEQYQRTYIQLVASNYYLTSNVKPVDQALDGWDRQALNQLINTMQNETTDAATRQQLTALADVLKLPGSDRSLMSSLLSQQGLVISLLVSAAPLLAALGLIVIPWLRRRSQTAETLAATSTEEQSEASLEELLSDIDLEAQAPQIQEEQQQTAEEKKAEEEEKKAEEEEEENKDQDGGSLGDLSSLFEDEDTSLSALETFCKGMLDVTLRIYRAWQPTSGSGCVGAAE